MPDYPTHKDIFAFSHVWNEPKQTNWNMNDVSVDNPQTAYLRSTVPLEWVSILNMKRTDYGTGEWKCICIICVCNVKSAHYRINWIKTLWQWCRNLYIFKRNKQLKQICCERLINILILPTSLDLRHLRTMQLIFFATKFVQHFPLTGYNLKNQTISRLENPPKLNFFFKFN